MVDIDWLLKHPKLPLFETLLIGFKCYLECSDDSNLNAAITAISEVSGTDVDRRVRRTSDKIYPHVARFETVLGGKVFERTRGPKREQDLIDIPEERLIRKMAEVEQILAAVERFLREDVLTIGLLASETLDHRLLAGTQLEFMVNQSDGTQRVDFREATGLPNRLRERGARGEGDIVVTACPADFPLPGEETNDFEIIEEVPLQLQLLCPMTHELAKGYDVSKFTEKDVLVLLDERERLPMPPYPEIPEKPKKVYVDTVEKCYSRAIEGALTYAYPELLTKEERRVLEPVPIDTEKRITRMCLLRSKKAKHCRTAEENNKIDEFQKLIKKRMAELSVFSEEKYPALAGEKWVLHVSEVKERTYQWLVGEISLRLWGDGYLRGEHRVLKDQDLPKPEDVPGPFELIGGIKETKGICQIVWRAADRRKSRGEGEDYAASFLTETKNLAQNEGILIGVWAGQKSWATNPDKDILPGIGYMVIVDKAAAVVKGVRKKPKVQHGIDRRCRQVIDAINPHECVEIFKHGQTLALENPENKSARR